MEVNRKLAIKKWDEQFGKAVDATDFSGRKIQKGAFGQLTSTYGWTLTYIIPKAVGGTEVPENLICVHVKTASEKEQNFPSFNANDVKYKLTKESGRWEIIPSKDEDAIAEQKEKEEKAMELWNLTFGDAESATDFAGRTIHKNSYGSGREGAWKVAPYVDSKPTEKKNAYIANLFTIAEALGKTAFRSNGKFFTLNKENGVYTFNEGEQKPFVSSSINTESEATFDVIDVSVEDNGIEEEKIEITSEEKDQTDDTVSVISTDDAEDEKTEEPVAAEKEDESLASPKYVSEQIDRIIDGYKNPETQNTWLDFIVIHALFPSGALPETAAALTNAVSSIIKEAAGEFLAFDVSELTDEDGSRNTVLTYRFATPSTADMERIFNTSMLLNTYAPLVLEKFGLSLFKVYNFASVFETVRISYPSTSLAEFNSDFKTFMTCVFGMTEFYEGEAPTTLYVSDSVIYNIPALREVHSENALSRTDARLTEHNYVFGDIKQKLDELNSI